MHHQFGIEAVGAAAAATLRFSILQFFNCDIQFGAFCCMLPLRAATFSKKELRRLWNLI